MPILQQPGVHKLLHQRIDFFPVSLFSDTNSGTQDYYFLVFSDVDDAIALADGSDGAKSGLATCIGLSRQEVSKICFMIHPEVYRDPMF